MYSSYLLTESMFYTPVVAYEHADDWASFIAAELGSGWSYARWSYWLQFDCAEKNRPDQGFKIHIAPDFADLQQQVVDCVRILRKHRAGFKIVADRRLVGVMNGKTFSRTASAKFFTIYPTDDKEFHSLAKELAASENAARRTGPYILTDRRVPGASTVFYRYGGFTRMEMLRDDGERLQLIRNPVTGQMVEDRREPAYHLPSWVEEPFPMPAAPASSGGGLLNGRYRVTSAIYFSNSGGVYKAEDLSSGTTVILKEARPHAGIRDAKHLQADGLACLRHEFSMMRRLAAVPHVVAPIDYFEAWEHEFLVEEYIELPTWRTYFATDGVILSPFSPGATNPAPFLQRMVPALADAVSALRLVHAQGIVLGDLSSTNLLVDAEGERKVRIIDLESACDPTEALPWQEQWGTRGFRDQQRANGARRPEDDWFALSKCVLDAMVPIAHLPDIGIGELGELIDFAVRTNGLPEAFGHLVHAIRTNDQDTVDHRLSFLRRLYVEQGEPMRRMPIDLSNQVLRPRATVSQETVDGIARFIELARGRVSTGQEHWPADPKLYNSNKWNIAYGSAGISAFLHRCGRPVPDEVKFRPDDLAQVQELGLYYGATGVAAVQSMDGDHALAKILVDHLHQGETHFYGAGLFGGAAGIGLAMLSIAHSSHDERAMDVAASVVGWLSERAQKGERDAVFWPTPGGREEYGLGKGSAGIAFFLASYAADTGSEQSAALARGAIQHVITNARLDARLRPQWGRDETDPRFLPYHIEGAAGIGAALLRTGWLLKEPAHTALGVRLAESAFNKLTVSPGQFSGLAGILEFLTDVSMVSNDPKVVWMRDEVVDGMTRYFNHRDGAIAIPGEYCIRYACDYATGSAGVGMALARVVNPGPRPLFDFALPSARCFGGA
ncbi:class III lanthionine synthetase LanKC [Luteibacter sahnii]|uniref:class III lanthionine synthetase LanKC n=1 Tax=Luteibacter sahnii TaxID=3021977 RepID=UPI002A6AC937|nr:class III lanthionine synthetase LanKC [Luteibacter sp. PPL193]MDY1549576.1 class III lanthionine synthetase LanKC [Luteibacter sp. PPL193]